MKGMEEYAKLAAEDLKKDVQKAGKTVKQQIESTAPKKCEARRWKDKGVPSYRSGGAGRYRAADKGY